VTIRKLTVWEMALAREVFGAALVTARARLVFHRLPAPFAVTLGRFVAMPGRVIDEFAAESLEAQAWLVHELTHVWQFQTAPVRTLTSWARLLITGGYGPGSQGYRYTLPTHWSALNLEQQAAVVEDQFRLDHGLAVRFGPSGARRGDYAGLTPFPVTKSP
jgi:hypothetical protein